MVSLDLSATALGAKLEETQTPGFINARLAAAAAIPPEQRSADVAAFIEYCQLQQEVLEASEAPGYTWQCTDALKLVRAEYISPGGVLFYSQKLLASVAQRFCLLVRGHMDANNYDCDGQAWRPGGLGQAILRALQQDPQLVTWATVAASMDIVYLDKDRAGMVDMASEAVVMLQQSPLRRRLQRELAKAAQQLGRPLLSYDQLLAFFVDFAAGLACAMEAGTDTEKLGRLHAIRTAVQLLPKLAPDSPSACYFAAMLTQRDPPAPSIYPLLCSALRVSQEHRSDVHAALCGYQLAGAATLQAALKPELLGDYPPSVALGWLEQAAGAHRRCKLLPKQWTCQLDRLKAEASLMKPWLEQLQAEGECWRPAPAKLTLDIWLSTLEHKAVLRSESPRVALECDGCGRTAGQLRRCANCKEVQYCR